MKITNHKGPRRRKYRQESIRKIFIPRMIRLKIFNYQKKFSVLAMGNSFIKKWKNAILPNDIQSISTIRNMTEGTRNLSEGDITYYNNYLAERTKLDKTITKLDIRTENIHFLNDIFTENNIEVIKKSRPSMIILDVLSYDIALLGVDDDNKICKLHDIIAKIRYYASLWPQIITVFMAVLPRKGMLKSFNESVNCINNTLKEMEIESLNGTFPMNIRYEIG